MSVCFGKFTGNLMSKTELCQTCSLASEANYINCSSGARAPQGSTYNLNCVLNGLCSPPHLSCMKMQICTCVYANTTCTSLKYAKFNGNQTKAQVYAFKKNFKKVNSGFKKKRGKEKMTGTQHIFTISLLTEIP